MSRTLGVSTLILTICHIASAITQNAVNPPVIDDQPIGRVASEGAPVALSVAAHGTGSLSYQWRNGAVLLTNNSRISGATSNVLSFAPCLTNDSGSYSVIVTASALSVTSAVVPLTINRFGVGLTPTGTGAVVSITGQPADVYRVEVSVNFGPYITNGFATNRTGPAEFIDVDNNSGSFRQLRVAYDRLLPILFAPAKTDVGQIVRAYGTLNEAWRFEATTNFLTWTNLATFTNSTGWVKFTDTDANLNGRRFYRISRP